MKKLFQTTDSLQLSAYRHIKYSGAYEIDYISEQAFKCIMTSFSIHITGKQLIVHYLQEDGFFLSCDAIESIHVERV
ncbi:MAG: hypothetical protein ABS949_05875 [Solibacillus sp.]